MVKHKDDTPVRLRNSLLGILNIKGYRFINNETDEKRISLNLEEIKLYYPELISDCGEIDYIGFIAVIMEAINELNQKIDTMEKEKLKRKYRSDYNS